MTGSTGFSRAESFIFKCLVCFWAAVVLVFYLAPEKIGQVSLLFLSVSFLALASGGSLFCLIFRQKDWAFRSYLVSSIVVGLLTAYMIGQRYGRLESWALLVVSFSVATAEYYLGAVLTHFLVWVLEAAFPEEPLPSGEDEYSLERP